MIENHKKDKNFLAWDFAYSFKFQRIEKRFDKLWEMKVSARNSLADWLVVSDIPPRAAEICANACSELIENTIKYSRNGTIVTVMIHFLDNTIAVETCNAAEEEYVKALRQSLAALAAAPDPKQLFIERLLNPVEDESRLGLIKIVMETKGTVECLPAEDANVIRIRLRMQAAQIKEDIE